MCFVEPATEHMSIGGVLACEFCWHESGLAGWEARIRIGPLVRADALFLFNAKAPRWLDSLPGMNWLPARFLLLCLLYVGFEYED
jgi:hypothetical protein